MTDPLPLDAEVWAAALACLRRERGHPRAPDVMAEAALELSPSARTWTAERGEMTGVRASLFVSAEALAEIDRRPAIEDAIVDAVARALAAHPGWMLDQLTCHWSDSLRAPGPYRSAGPPHRAATPPVPTVAALAPALSRWLHADGLELAALEVGEHGVTVTLHGGSTVHLESALARFVTRLLGTGWRVELQQHDLSPRLP